MLQAIWVLDCIVLHSPQIFYSQEYFMDLYLLAELKTISLKITTVDMKRPPADFRSNFEVRVVVVAVSTVFKQRMQGCGGYKDGWTCQLISFVTTENAVS